MPLIEASVDRLANSLRIRAEENMRSKSLFLIDKEEAVNNLDRIFEMIIENFHSLYDVSMDKFDYSGNADTALVIFLRNAIHHRNHELFRSWNSEMHLHGGIKKNFGASFLMANYIDDDGVILGSEVYYRLQDFTKRLEDPNLRGFSPEKRTAYKRMFEKGLNFGQIYEKAKAESYPDDQIYINVMPIVCSAIAKVFAALSIDGFQPKGFDSEVYHDHFSAKADYISAVIYKKIRFNNDVKI